MSRGPRHALKPSWVLLGGLADDPERAHIPPSPTLVGTTGGARRGIVDGAGLCATKAGWSLDWWVRTADRWLFPAQLASERSSGPLTQQLVELTPVTETTLRVPGGAAGARVIHRAYAARAQGRDVVVVEIANDAHLPIALAAAVRPYDPAGLGRIDVLSVSDDRVLVNDLVALWCEREPNGVHAATGGVDAASLLGAGAGKAASKTASKTADKTADKTAGDVVVECQDGWANAALLWTLVHGSSLRLVLPLDDEVASSPPSRIGSSVEVARGWRSHADAAWRCVLPSGRVAQAFTAARTQLPLAIGDVELDVVPWGPRASQADEAVVLTALVEMGYAPAVIELLLARAQQTGGRGDIAWRQRDVTASTLIAAGELLRYGSADGPLLAALAEVVADAARWLLAQTRTKQPSTKQPSTDATTQRALDAAELWLTAAGETRASQALDASRPAATDWATTNWATTDRASTDRASHAGDVRLLAARVAQLAQDAPAAAVPLLETLLDHASPTFSWPSPAELAAEHQHAGVVTPLLGAGCDLVVTAQFCAAVRRLLLAEVWRDDTLCVEVARLWPTAWLGAEMEVNDLPITAGPATQRHASFAVRWHGERPALLWEIDHADHAVTLTAPGLDPTFVAHTATGEALLRVPAR